MIATEQATSSTRKHNPALPLKAYLVIIRNSLMSLMYYRVHFLFQVVGNAVYIVITWFLWQAIYAGQAELNGLSFQHTFLYLSLAMSVFVLLQTWTEWDVSRQIISGDIVGRFIKPLSFKWQTFADVCGGLAGNFIAITIPSFLIIIFAFQAPIDIGWNLPLFLVSLAFGILINFAIDYSIGLIAFYTESIWGISATKQALVLFLSGALIPLAFFPEVFRNILEWLPFQAIYNAPLSILIRGAEMGAVEVAKVLAVQAGWVAILWILTTLWERRAFRVLTVNGG